MATRQYIGARYVPKFYTNSVDGSTQWESNVVYEPLTYVTLQNGHMYIAKKQVPATVGTPASNVDYWLDVGSYNGFIDSLQDEIDIINNTTIPAIEKSIDPVDFDIIVAADGSGDYTSLTAAVAAATSGQRIFVKAGTYNNETVDCQTKKLVIIGENKYTTKIRNGYDDYYRAPIEIGSGYVENISFESTGTGGDPPSYAAHIDYQSMTNNDLTFVNCYFSSISTFAVGIGMKNHGKLNFIDCEFISQSTTTGCFFVHPSTDSSNYGSDQMLTCINCKFTSASAVVITTSKHGDNTNIVYALFMGCYLRGSGAPREGLIFQSDNGVDTGRVIFLKGSGNNYPFLNQDTYHNTPTTVGRWDNYAVKRAVYSGSCSAGVQGSFALPSDCSIVLEYTAYFKHGSIWYPAGVKNDASATDYHNAYFVCETNDKTGYYKSVSDGSYRIVLTYVSDNIQFV